jgi:hypothetical protein
MSGSVSPRSVGELYQLHENYKLAYQTWTQKKILSLQTRTSGRYTSCPDPIFAVIVKKLNQDIAAAKIVMDRQEALVQEKRAAMARALYPDRPEEQRRYCEELAKIP